MLRLPRLLLQESNPALVDALMSRLSPRAPLWPGGQQSVARLEWTPALAGSVRFARHCHWLVGGVEAARREFTRMDAGKEALGKRGLGEPGAGRISRLLLVSKDASQRARRAVESMVRGREDSCLVVEVGATGQELGAALGPPEVDVVHVLLVSHKRFVAGCLRAMVGDGAGPGSSLRGAFGLGEQGEL